MLAPGRQNHAASYYRRPSPVRSSHGFVEVVNKEAHYSQLLSDTEVAQSWEKGSGAFLGYEVSLGGNENVLELDGGNGCTSLC